MRATDQKITYHKINAKLDEFVVLLDETCQRLALDLSAEQKTQLLRYLDGLLLWSKAYNLTAITTPKDALIKHIFDCLAIVPDFVPSFLPDFASTHANAPFEVLDIGTGAGLPALILAIVRPDWQVTALDSNSKKIRFIRQMVSELQLSNLNPVASRIEAHAGSYDIISSRAFASLEDFVHLASPYLKTNGCLCAMKGKAPSKTELDKLHGWQTKVTRLSVPRLNEDRCLVHVWR